MSHNLQKEKLRKSISSYSTQQVKVYHIERQRKVNWRSEFGNWKVSSVGSSLTGLVCFFPTFRENPLKRIF